MEKKILLIGEYSGFHINLKRGFEELGISCTLAANGDEWKKIAGADIELYKNGSTSLIKKIYQKIIRPFFTCKKLYGYDVVQLIDPKIYHPYVNKRLFNKIRKKNKRVFVTVPGQCFSLYQAYKDGKLGYNIFDDNPHLCHLFDQDTFSSKIQAKQEKYIYEHCDGVIPVMYEYAVGVRDLPNCKKTIPLPFDPSCVEYAPNIAGEKVVILHGLIREEAKGSAQIKQALEIIKERYPDEVEIIIDGKMPLNDYLKLLGSVNILIDQCKEHCYGMNALYAMAMGRIVLGGASENSLAEYELTECPVFHITPDVDQIVSQIEKVIKMKSQYKEMGEQAREFVERVHDSKKLAKEYLRQWGEEELLAFVEGKAAPVGE